MKCELYVGAALRNPVESRLRGTLDGYCSTCMNRTSNTLSSSGLIEGRSNLSMCATFSCMQRENKVP